MRYVALLLLLAAAPAPGSDDDLAMQGHQSWIIQQQLPDGTECCAMADGRPAEVRRQNGQWEVLYSREHWADGDGRWLSVPATAILRQPSPLLTPIAWISGGHVRCLALPGAA